MITDDELINNGFSISEYSQDWIHEDHQGTGFSMEDGIINWCRNADNYNGLSVKITTIYQLLSFLTFLK